jgi:D-inositol-3-phosphate glycosyltransferase
MSQNPQSAGPVPADMAGNGKLDSDHSAALGLPNQQASNTVPPVAVTLLTGGSDKHYAFGLASELISGGVAIDLIGSDELDCPEFRCMQGLNFLNLRGDQRSNVGFVTKMFRVTRYYAQLVRYAATAKPKIFHILWNNKFETFDRTLLILYYRLLGKKIVLTVHNVNAAKRDSVDSFHNRFTLRIQYQLADHIFVHTEKMKLELIEAFGVRKEHITIIPFGINNAVPETPLTSSEAKQKLGLQDGERTILFFGRITPYKGLEYLITAFRQLQPNGKDYRLIIAGRPDRCERYWSTIREEIGEDVRAGRILLRSEFIPDEETEVYFKAADVLVLPYRNIYQSGVLFLGHSFGLPVLTADVGSLKDEIVEGKTGFVFKSEDPLDLGSAIQRYFASDLFADLSSRRQEIREYAAERHSWDVVGQKTIGEYANLLFLSSRKTLPNCDTSKASLDMHDHL